MMAEKRIHCWNCSSYDREALKCRVGKANPKRKLDSITVAELMGVETLCLLNPHREALVQRINGIAPLGFRDRQARIEQKY